MGLFGKLLGTKDAAALEADAEARLAAGDFGRALAGFERALDRMPEGDTDGRARVTARIAATKDAIAAHRLDDGERLLETGQHDLAAAEAEGALAVTADPTLVARAQTLLRAAARRPVGANNEDAVKLSDEERWLALAASWTETQAAEYDQLGEAFSDAMLTIMKAAEAAPSRDEWSPSAADADREASFEAPLQALRSLAAQSGERAVYLLFELGRAELAAGHPDASRTELRRFLERLPPGEGDDARLVAHIELARLAEQTGGADDAMAELEAAVSTMPDDPRPYLALGQYLRRKGFGAEAVDVLHSALAVLGEGEPDWRILAEFGLAEHVRGRADAAAEYLERVVSFFTTRRVFDLPPEATSTLAEIHATAGRFERAADLYRLLVEGSDRARRGTYARRAADALRRAGAEPQAREFLERVAEGAAAAGDEATAREAREALAEPGDGAPLHAQP